MEKKAEDDKFGAMIAEFNRRAMLGEFTVDERANIRRFFRNGGPADQLEVVLRERERHKWLLHAMWGAIVAVPAISILWGVWSKIMEFFEWLKGH